MSTYCTRVYVKVDSKDLMDTLCSIEIGDIGKGFYKADDIFKANSKVSTFRDTESGINENDLITLVTRVVSILNLFAPFAFFKPNKIKSFNKFC